MKTPQKFYRICEVNANCDIRLFNTGHFGEPNNWFEKEEEAEEWIKENFIDAHPYEGSNVLTLIVLPVFTITFKK